MSGILSSDIGAKGPTSNETTQTTSGNGRGIAGNKNQYTESGSISVGQKGVYTESGGLNLAGQRIKLGKGATLTLNQSPAPATSAVGLNANPQPIASPSSGGSQDTSTIVPTPAGPIYSSPTAAPPDSSTSTSSGIWDTIKTYWANFSTWQKIGGATVVVLLLWLIFHKRGK